MQSRVVLASVLIASVNASGITLDVMNWGGSPRLFITASAKDADGADLPAKKLLIDSGSATLAFCDSSLAHKLKPFQTQYYSCSVYGDSHEETGYWGPFYKGVIHISKSDIEISSAYFVVMQQQVEMGCTSSFDGIFGIAFRQQNPATTKEPSWPSSRIGSCPDSSREFVPPLMQYLNNQGGTKQIGIYWSGRSGEDQGQLFLDDDAKNNNPYYNAGIAGEIGKVKLDIEQGFYAIHVQSVAYKEQSYRDFSCSGKGSNQCVFDTGCPAITVPQAAYDAMVQGDHTGDLTMKFEGVHGASVELKFDVRTLVVNEWLEGAPPGGTLCIGLPLRAFYYAVADISDFSLSFSPMAAYFKKKHMNTTVIV
jgi:hypothetical protein